MSVRLSERTNEYFIKLLGSWLVSDVVASYFVFDILILWTKEVKWWNGIHINRGIIQNKWEYALVNDNDGLIIWKWLTWHWIWHYIVSCWLWFRSIPWINDSWIPKLSESYYRVSTYLSSGRTRSSCVTVTCLAAAFTSLSIATVDTPNCPLRLVRQKQSSLRARILKEYGDGLQ